MVGAVHDAADELTAGLVSVDVTESVASVPAETDAGAAEEASLLSLTCVDVRLTSASAVPEVVGMFSVSLERLALGADNDVAATVAGVASVVCAVVEVEIGVVFGTAAATTGGTREAFRAEFTLAAVGRSSKGSHKSCSKPPAGCTRSGHQRE